MTLDLRWVAAFFDGEGSVSLYHGRTNKGNAYKTFRLTASITQKNPMPLRTIQEHYGGSLVFHPKSGVYQLTFGSRLAERFLLAIYPLSNLKKKVIELAFEYRTLMKNKVTNPGVQGRMHSPVALKRMLEIRDEIRRINALD